ncbi:aldo/keto reductase [Paraclostridium sordellii]|uniref:aldo/keto reductase n=1 Tax=Paraclostridium sordellii TaxID=1505 RepID=UPI0005E87ACC|nr:aldo/keto reductase [Paeniclostridium sordellii]CEO07791.1 aldo/keto reductase family oxidoreductase [[Clostridium] sordellii] [Paeniclostridium sordellii]CEP86995.1 aldo/keto reductase family oxidoreductase [[Clostridium] sordellii] [Paeniclostridium sordellii]CEP95332.1 aldo/keto reductase family oxidoreductase [[Clostridium] sordellii] [Paeniclostridium sordellii]CEP99328.1 aldo/keto reductase family oxidoreductase [[Clostridium] sordellii] [Paeniclostridium sordellii]
MRYREFGSTGEKISILGFGCMRFPQTDGKINEDETLKMVRYAIDSGVNYIDTAYPYHGGESELVVGRILKDGYREKVNLATKLPSWNIKSREDMDKYLNEQLKKLQTNYIDFYLVHALDEELWDNLVKNGIFDFLDEIKRNKKVRYVGFSFHDKYEVFEKIIDDYDWDFTQIQYNYIDEEYQAGTKGLEYAYKKGLGIVIMEPLRGGKLVNNLSDDIKDIIKFANTQKSPTKWAFKFLYNKSEIGIVLSGMSTMEQVIENIKICDEEGKANSMTKDEKKIISNLGEKFKSKIKVDCTACKYCIPCPRGVNIPGCFEALNNASMFDDVESVKINMYKFIEENESDASMCIECGKCEVMCPQHINIIDKLKEVKYTFK